MSVYLCCDSHDFIPTLEEGLSATVKSLWNHLLFLFQQMWVFDEEIGMNQREITYVPGLYKIFDEILGEWLHAARLSAQLI